uniref:Secreted protein n=1 Tax=Knipowitschia caucasica TaxID=637954 RepID=A0AAV2KQ64_KNICA
MLLYFVNARLVHGHSHHCARPPPLCLRSCARSLRPRAFTSDATMPHIRHNNVPQRDSSVLRFASCARVCPSHGMPLRYVDVRFVYATPGVQARNTGLRTT